eukprot:c4710_g1_i2.p1 GENE.c4710_g1_i2~~c4710_g1_i2.p1  ORF type:complete len:171 (-),score=29.28 c4710_g1_i2:61-573(-)
MGKIRCSAWGNMQIFVRGIDGGLSTLQISECESVAALRQRVAFVNGIDASELRLSANGMELVDDAVLASCLSDNSTLESMMRLLGGGGKKRKKKNYSTPKKIRHKHKKVKLATLKYYKVDNQGKIVRLRRECTHPMCGPGIFMANHFDRQYCGKCFTTFKFDSAKKEESK